MRELDARLALPLDREAQLTTEIERAALLGALDRKADAQAAFIDILRRHPTHFSALNEFGTLLAAQGAIDAACRVYAEAILHHPENPMAHVNLGNLLLRANRHAEARAHYEAALKADPDHAAAHQGMGAVLADEGDRNSAREHFAKGFRGHAVSTLPYRGSRPADPAAATGVVWRRQYSDRAVSRRLRVSDVSGRGGLSRPRNAAAAASPDLQRDRRP